MTKPGNAVYLASRAETPCPLDRFLRGRMPGVSWKGVRRLIATGKVTLGGVTAGEPTIRVGPGDSVGVNLQAPLPQSSRRLAASALAYVDQHLVVVRKPAGISTVPYGAESNTLDQLVRALLNRGRLVHRRSGELGVVHRLDKETSGLLVFSRTLAAKRNLASQFRAHSVQRTYVALARGVVQGGTIASRLVRDRGDGLRGSTNNPRLGKVAITHVRVLERFVGATLVECTLETGRTHQIRIHLAESGHPLVGERVYRLRAAGSTGTEGSSLMAPRLMLHAGTLGFVHPITGRPLSFNEPWPEDLVAMVASLRQTRQPS